MTFQRKLFVRFTSLFLAVLTVFGAALILGLWRSSIDDAVASNMNMFGTLISMIDQAPAGENSEMDQQVLSEVGENFVFSLFTVQASVMIQDVDHQEIYCSEPRISWPDYDNYYPEDDLIWYDVIGENVVISTRLHAREETYFVRYYAGIHDVYERLWHSVAILIAADILAAILSAWVIALFSRRITRPLSDLAVQVQQIGITGKSMDQPVVSDITEIQQLSDSFQQMSGEIASQMDALKAQNEAKQRFIDGLTHEIRTPLTSIIGYSSLLLCRPADAQTTKSSLRAIHDNGLRIQNLTENMVKLISLSRDELNESTFSLSELLGEIQSDFQGRLEEYGGALSIRGEDIRLHTDRELLRMLISNFTDNAVKAVAETPEKRVILEIKKEGLIVSDTGKGIPAEDLEKIFEPFFMVDRSRKRSMGGFGLGLAISDSIMRLLGITVTVQSEPGKGTEINLTFSADMIQL